MHDLPVIEGTPDPRTFVVLSAAAGLNGVGVALLWDRLTGRPLPRIDARNAATGAGALGGPR